MVNVTIPLSEFLKLYQQDTECEVSAPGEIEGLGYVASWVIRDLVEDVAGRKGTGFRGVVFDDTTGTFLASTTTKYRRPAWLENYLQLRDKYCRFPGCRKAARRCDIDHVRAYTKGGPTAPCNLHCLCRHHHRLKQDPRWGFTYLDGYAVWTSPTGHVYISEPHDWRDGPPPNPNNLPPDQPPDQPPDNPPDTPPDDPPEPPSDGWPEVPFDGWPDPPPDDWPDPPPDGWPGAPPDDWPGAPPDVSPDQSVDPPGNRGATPACRYDGRARPGLLLNERAQPVAEGLHPRATERLCRWPREAVV